MLSGMILTVGSLFFLILLAFSYYSKKNNSSVTSKLFKIFLIATFLMTGSEVMAGIIFDYSNSTTLEKIFLRFNWFFGLFYFLVFYYYTYCYVYDVNSPSILKVIERNLEIKVYSIVWSIAVIVYLFLDFNLPEGTNFSFVPGNAAYFVMIFGAVTIIGAIRNIFINDIPKRAKIAFTFLAFAMLGVEILQFFIDSVSLFGIGITLGVYIIYFIVENPDLKYIEETDMLKNAIERSSKAKSDFLSNMSHEIRSPMNAIIGFSATILDEQEFDPQRVLNDISHIKSSSKTLLDIINNILDISKIETGSDTLEEKEYSLSSHILDWTGIVKTRLENKNIKFALEVDRDIPKVLYGDATKVFQVVLNILTNSVKYTEVGRINMTIAKEVVNSKLIKLKFKVADTGFGIKKEDYNKVFQKFSRLDSAKTNEIEGTGLGLVLTKKYAQLMGGDIWFESVYGAGSTFYFEVPQKVIDPTPMGDIVDNMVATQSKGDYIDCSKYTAAVVDDDRLNLQVTERLLSAYKFNIVKIQNGDECIFKYKSGEHFDIVFLDDMMPGVSGIEIAHVIKSLKDFDMPVLVALTANAITGSREMYLKEGFDEYLSKPIDVNELDKIINLYFKDNSNM